MDRDNLELINYYAPSEHSASVHLFLEFANNRGVTSERVVPDPYYGGAEGFENVFALVESGCDALIEHILNA